MSTVNVQFSDSTEATIVAYFGGEPDPKEWPNLGTVSTSDARWATFYASQTEQLAKAGCANLMPAPTSS